MLAVETDELKVTSMSWHSPDEGSVRLSGPIRSVLHIVPFSAAEPTYRIDLSGLHPGGRVWQALFSLGWMNFRPSFEGYLFVGGASPSGASRYLQVFRNGAIEHVFTDESIEPPGANMRYVRMRVLEGSCRNALLAAIGSYRQLGVEPPVFVMYALCGVRGTVIDKPQHSMWQDGVLLPLNKDALVAQERLLESFDADVDALLHPMFDEVWNASGWSGSPSWDSSHKWLGG